MKGLLLGGHGTTTYTLCVIPPPPKIHT
jgi:hypothetical protein